MPETETVDFEIDELYETSIDLTEEPGIKIDFDDETRHAIERPAPVKPAGSFSLRDYQEAAVQSIDHELMRVRSTLAVLATGAGKTVIFSQITLQEVTQRGGKVLIIAHTEELLDQAAEKLRKTTGLDAAREKAADRASTFDDVVVASVQTMGRPVRLETWAPDHFGLIIIDEAHRSLATTYRRIIDHFTSAKVLGVTATADRGDQKSLGRVYDSIAFEYGILEACRDGYLVRPWVQTVPLSIDLSGLIATKGKSGDYNAIDVADRIEPFLREIAKVLAEMERNDPRRTIIFLPSVDTASMMADALKSEGLTADFVAGDKKRCPDRKRRLAAFDRGEFQFIANAMLLCLDMETEILTDKGFVSHSEITRDHLVANWVSDGTVYFERPREIVKRPTYDHETMVSVESRTLNFRVTNTHKMLVSCLAGNKGWKKIPADRLRNGHRLPTCGIAEPLHKSVPNKEQSSKCRNTRITSIAYNIRKSSPQITNKESREIAKERVNHSESLRYKQPSELSLNECRLIGFWIADGSRCKLRSGGVEYIFTQSPKYEHIVKWLDGVLVAVGVDFRKSFKAKSPQCFKWSLPRGTGFGPQQRNGVFPIELYLNKSGCDYFWGLNKTQFDALVEGYWYGDGYHGSAENGMPDSICFNETNKQWIDMLCAIGSVRGWRCAMYPRPQKNKKHRHQWHLRMRRDMKASISLKTEIKNEKPKGGEMVWCVKTSSKNIITRRKGQVTVMGNTEGWDSPAVARVVNLRPTKIRGLFCQIVGRGTRVLPGVIDHLNGPDDREARIKAIAASAKPNLQIVDFLWITEKLDLIKPANLVSGDPEVVKRMIEKSEDGDLIDQEEEAERDLLESIKREAEKNRNKKGKTFDPLEKAFTLGDEELASYRPDSQWAAQRPTDDQVKILVKHGLDPARIRYRGLAAKWIQKVITREKMGLCSLKQMSFLDRMKIPGAHQYTAEDAKKAIGRRIQKFKRKGRR